MRILDLTTWPRRASYEHFRDYAFPCFSVTTNTDVTKLLETVRKHALKPVSLVYHYCSTRAANELEPFRMRRRGDQVVVHDSVVCGTIIPVGEEQLDFLNIPYRPDLKEFLASGLEISESVRARTERMRNDEEDDAIIYHSVLPWISFTGVIHAHPTANDSIPRITFGKHFEQNGRVLLPIGIEVDHALMDGLHVARFLERFQQLCDTVQP